MAPISKIAPLLFAIPLLCGYASPQQAVADEPSTVVDAVREMPMGSVCLAAILQSVSEIGKRCVEREDPEVRAAIDRSIGRLDERFRTVGGWTEAGLEKFKTQMGERETPTDALCRNEDALVFYQSMAEAGPKSIDETTDAVLAKPGKPEWGTCL